MFRSIRGKFLGWLSVFLVLVIGGFGGSLYVLLSRSRMGEIDAELAGAAQVLAEKLRSRRPPPPPGRKNHGRPEPADPWARRPDPRPPRGGPSIQEVAARIELPPRRFEEDAGATYYFAIWSPEGDLLRQSRSELKIPLPELPLKEGAWAVRRRQEFQEHILRGPRGTLVLAGKSIDREAAEDRRLVGFLVLAGGSVMVIGLAGAWFISRRAMRPIGAISAAAEEISAQNLDRRIDLDATETELGSLARLLNSAFDRLQGSIERQARFTADASHELRTPVSVVLTQTSMARRKERSAEEYREVIEACHAAAARMKSLVDGLMTLARTDAGELRPQTAACDLRQVIDECADLLAPLALEKGVAIRRELGEATVEGDPELLVQVVSNLLSNAIRYNQKGGQACIRLRVEGAEAALSVTDTGIGIPSEDLPRIFDRFYRVDRARSSREGGTGLGLAIVKAIVTAHGGTIVCESKPGEGSTFAVRLPLQSQGVRIPPPRRPAPSRFWKKISRAARQA